MSLFIRPIHWYHSRADLIWPIGPFKYFFLYFFYFTCIIYNRIEQNRIEQNRIMFISPQSKFSMVRRTGQSLHNPPPPSPSPLANTARMYSTPTFPLSYSSFPFLLSLGYCSSRVKMDGAESDGMRMGLLSLCLLFILCIKS